MHKDDKVGMLISPSNLTIFIVNIFFYSMVINEYFLQPAMTSIYSLLDIPRLTISHWHGFNTEILMTFALVIGGILVYFALDQFKVIYRMFPERWSFDTLYATTVERIDTVSKRLTSLYMSRNLRHYLMYIFVFLLIVVGFVMVYTNSFNLFSANDRPICK